MSEKVSQVEMMKRLGIKSLKTLKRLVQENSLPYYQVGKTRMFDPAKVFARLEQMGQSHTVTQPIKKKNFSPRPNQEFRDMLGI